MNVNFGIVKIRAEGGHETNPKYFISTDPQSSQESELAGRLFYSGGIYCLKVELEIENVAI